MGIALADNLIEEIGEHHGLLQGVLETCLKEDYPEHYARVIDITYRFSEGWRRLHNPETGAHVTSDLTTTEFSIAMLASRGWSNTEIANQRQDRTTAFPTFHAAPRKRIDATSLESAPISTYRPRSRHHWDRCVPSRPGAICAWPSPKSHL